MSTKDKVLGRIFGDPQKKIVHRLEKRVAEINALGDKYARMSDQQLSKQTNVLKKQLAKLTKKASAEAERAGKTTEAATHAEVSDKQLEKGLVSDRQLVNKMSPLESAQPLSMISTPLMLSESAKPTSAAKTPWIYSCLMLSLWCERWPVGHSVSVILMSS